MSPLRVLFGGYEAVILFFVLSGFVLSISFWSGHPIEYRPFIVKRVFRIYVPYLGALVLAVLADAAFSTHGIPALNSWFNATWRAPIRAGDVLAHIFLIGAYDDSLFNTAFWSLIHEMRISIVFPFVLPLVKALGRKGPWSAPVLILLGGWLNTQMPYGRIFASIQVLGFFLAGSYVARSRDLISAAYRQLSWQRRLLFALCSVGLFSFGWLWTFPMYALGWSLSSKDIFICAGACGLLILSLASPRFISFLRLREPRFLGRVSYSLYLVHATVLWSLICAFYGRVALAGIFPVYLAISLLLAFAFWKTIEDPAHRLGRRLARSSVVA